jgi:hypothetical protein
MALINCNECGKEISDKADVCVHCGNPIDDIENNKIGIKVFKFRWLIYILLITLLGVGIKLYSSLTSSITLYDKEFQVKEDHYMSFLVELKNTSEISINYNILSGPNLDVYFLSSTEFKKWERLMNKGDTGEELSYNMDLSEFDLPYNSKTQKLEKGTYYIVFDNTDYGPTYPPMNLKNDVSTLNFDVKVKE